MKKKQKLLILVGPPGSGKSTFAKYHINTEENWFRVCRDDLRLMQFNKENLERTEEVKLSKVVKQMVHTLLSNKSNVLIDATHTKKRYLDDLVKEFEYKATISFKLFDVSFDELKQRCQKRFDATGKFIPMNVLKKQFNSFAHLKSSYDFSERPQKSKELVYQNQSQELPKSIICDLDGTLALMNGRNPFDGSACLSDLPNPPVVNMVKNYKALGYNILLVSGRSDAYKPETKQWLSEYDIPYDLLVMRKDGDFRKDSIVKEEIFRGAIEKKYFVELVLDDRDQVVFFWRETLGLPCFQVYYGDF